MTHRLPGPSSWFARLAGMAGVLALLLFLAAPASAIERRKDQFPKEPSYLIVPLPYSLPGIGTGFFVPVFFSNIADSTTDAYALFIVGDAEGQMFGIEELHLVPEHLFVELRYQTLNKAVVNNYETRGMNGNGDDYTLIELSKVDNWRVGATASFWERQLEFLATRFNQKIQVDRQLDKDGNLERDFIPPYTDEMESTTFALRVDYTDDFQDPHKGVRFSLSRSQSPSDDPDDPEFYVRETAITGYIPLGEQSTLALHAFRSDAIVTRTGLTDLNTILDEKLGCQGDPGCQALFTPLANNFRLGNLNGTSTDLGGDQRMRAYPQSRFQGAHTLFYAAELRWNLTQEVTPFDYFIWKDVRTGIQLALFYEVGSVSETSDTLGDETRSDYGVGLRMVAGSGEVYRLDAATGDEGSEITVIVDYPF